MREPMMVQCCFCKGGALWQEAAHVVLPVEPEGKSHQGNFAHVACLVERLHPSFTMSLPNEEPRSPDMAVCCFCDGRVLVKGAAFLFAEPGDEAEYGFYAHARCVAERLYPGILWYWHGVAPAWLREHYASEGPDSPYDIIRGELWLRGAHEHYLGLLKAIRAAEASYRCSDWDAFVDSCKTIDPSAGGWDRLLRRIARMDKRPSAEFQRKFMRMVTLLSEHNRFGFGNDRPLVRALRATLPPYKGPPLHLYRGEGALNRRHRRYGLSWTLDRAVADSFARGAWRHTEGGGVLIETQASPNAIIAIAWGRQHSGKDEVLVDRRQLGEVRVLERYSQLPFDST